MTDAVARAAHRQTPLLTPATQRYFRGISDHVLRNDSMDRYRDLLVVVSGMGG